MKLRMCNCPACKAGRKSGWNRYMINHAKKAARHEVKIMIHMGIYENLPEAIWIPYTG